MRRAFPVHSCGVPRGRGSRRSRRPHPDARVRRAGWPTRAVYLFTLDRGDDEADVYTRMFAPDIGIPEDPATGSASGPLTYLVHHHLPIATGRPIRNLQGVRMGRPSWMYIEPVLEGTTITGMRVGGGAIVAGTGTLDLR